MTSETKEGGGNECIDMDLYITASAAVAHPQMDHCRLCGSTDKNALKACAGCKGVAYCCVFHQKSDWVAHKAACKLSVALREKKQGLPVCKMVLPMCGKAAIIRWLGDKKDAAPSYVEGAERIESRMLVKPEENKTDEAQRAAALADDPDAFDDDDMNDSKEASSLEQIQKLFAKANITSQQIPIAGIPELMDVIVNGDDLVIPGGHITLAFTYPLEHPAFFMVEVEEPRLSRRDMLFLLHKLYALVFFDCTGSFSCKLHSFDDLFLHSLFQFGSPEENCWAVVADT